MSLRQRSAILLLFCLLGMLNSHPSRCSEDQDPAKELRRIDSLLNLTDPATNPDSVFDLLLKGAAVAARIPNLDVTTCYLNRVDEFSLYAAARIDDQYTGVPLSRGASVQMTGVRSNCIVHIPLGVEGYEAGEEVNALLLVEEEELDQTVLICGIDNRSLEHLTELCLKEKIRIRVGPASGISALMLLGNAACHLASVSNEEDCSICGIEYQTKDLGSLRLVTKNNITDKKVRRVLELAAEI